MVYARIFPSRSTTTLIALPSVFLEIVVTVSNHDDDSFPSIDVILSPATKPDIAAGEPGTTLSRVLVGTPTYMVIIIIKINATSTLTAAPEAKTINLCHAGLLLNAPSSSLSSFSASIAQKPPIGMALSEYFVSPLSLLARSGPMPIANSFTLI